MQTLPAVRNGTLAPLLPSSTLTSLQTLPFVRNVTSAPASSIAQASMLELRQRDDSDMKSLHVKVVAVCCLIVILSVLMNLIVCFHKKRQLHNMNEQEPVPENEQEPVPENTQESVPEKSANFVYNQ
jgi:ABC-type microcin C transport system permease subunit YejE